MQVVMPVNEFTSQFHMGQDVEFLTPKGGECEGSVVGVRFTEAKVWYDIYSPYFGEVLRDIPSHNVKGMDTLNAPKMSESSGD